MAVAQVVVQLHEAQGRKAVEPGVGHRLHGVVKAVFLDAGNKLLALAINLGGPGLTGDDGDVALGLAGGHFQRAGLDREAQQISAGGDGGDEVFAGLGGVGLEFGFVHCCFALYHIVNGPGILCENLDNGLFIISLER